MMKLSRFTMLLLVVGLMFPIWAHTNSSSDYIQITSPNGDEIWYAGEKYEITWDASSTSGEVTIYLSSDGGYSWRIVTQTSNDGQRHIIPKYSDISGKCKIKIELTDTPYIYDVSDSDFIIAERSHKKSYTAFKIPATFSTPLVDGNLDDAIWQVAQPAESLLVGDQPFDFNVPWTQFEDNLVMWKAVWSESQNLLYIAIEVQDDIAGACDHEIDKMSNDDAIELYIDGDHQVGPYVDNRFAQHWLIRRDNRKWLGETEVEYTGSELITAVQHGRAGNWTMEIVMEVYDLFPNRQRTLASGDTLGFDIWYDDSDNHSAPWGLYMREHQVGWGYTGEAWTTADAFQNLVLGCEPEPVATKFREVSQSYGFDVDYQANAAVWLDYDNDDDLDLLVSGYYTSEHNRLYQNNGTRFVEVGAEVGLKSGHPTSTTGLCVGDYDNDADIDLLTFSGQYLLLRNDVAERGRFTEREILDGVSSFVDFDNDGDLDIYVLHRNSENMLYENREGVFHEIPDARGLNDTGFSRSAAWCDYDNDGDMDVFVVNGRHENSYLYQNNDSEFVNVTREVAVGNPQSGYGNGACWADYDNDGDFDLYLFTLSKNTLFRNDIATSGKFVDVTSTVGLLNNVESTDAKWGDFDNDGDQDLYVINSGENSLYENNVQSTGKFTLLHEMQASPDGYSGGTWGDFDKDGDLDFYLATPQRDCLFENLGNQNNWLHIEAIGTVSNRSAIGARVEVLIGDFTQTKFVETCSGFGSQNSLPVEFGLGLNESVDEVRIYWPSGIYQVLHNVPANQYIKIMEEIPQEPGTLTVSDYSSTPGEKAIIDITLDGNLTPISAFGLTIEYCPDKLTFENVSSGNLTSHFAFMDGKDSGAGTIIIGGANNNPIPENSNGTIARIIFTVNSNCQAGDNCEISITETIDDLVGLTTIPGTFVCEQTCQRGDVNQDNLITVVDALYAFRIFLNGGTPPEDCASPCALYAADANCDGMITTIDALTIFEAFIDGQQPPLECPSNSALAKEHDSETEIGLSQISGVSGEEILLPVHIQRNSGSLQTFGVDFFYPAEKLEFLGILRSSATENWQELDAVEYLPGKIKIGGFNPEGIENAYQYDLLYLKMKIKENVPDKIEIQLANPVDDAQGSQIVNGLIECRSTSEATMQQSEIPTDFSLGQNYPNPFNMETRISYALPEAGHVTITIYNSLGQKIRTLVNREHEAGTFQMLWNGCDDSGNPVTSGIYIYHLKSNKFNAVQKMILMK